MAQSLAEHLPTTATALPDYASLAKEIDGGWQQALLLVEGMHCASCAWHIERVLNAQNDVRARVNVTARRLALEWRGPPGLINELLPLAHALGYRFLPADDAQDRNDLKQQRQLLEYLAVAAFGSGNIMLLSLSLWFTTPETMGDATRALLHWLSVLVALPTVAYAGQPFFRSAWRALARRRTNMDVPIAVGILLTCGMSLWETIRHGPYVYFDSAVMLVFLLLIGRYLDLRARGRAKGAAHDLLSMLHGTATVIDGDGPRLMFARDLLPGMRLRVDLGERIAADSMVITGHSTVDTSIINGESTPQRVGVGDTVFAGTVNIHHPLELIVHRSIEQSTLADMAQIMLRAEQRDAQTVRLSDRIAGYYTPVVHILALATFVGWIGAGVAWQQALLYATTVLIITCPCALGLAIPAVQVIASQALFRAGILLKSGNALERLGGINHLVFDKTGTLTLGTPSLASKPGLDSVVWQQAASLAAHSRHPLAQALAKSFPGPLLPLSAQEYPGTGIATIGQTPEWRLGRGDWVGAVTNADDAALELWFSNGIAPPVRFAFTDTLRPDAKTVIDALNRAGFRISLLSGDRAAPTAAIARELGIKQFFAPVSPTAKAAMIADWQAAGDRVLMVGDGLNDAAAISSATVSLSPSSAAAITQNAADMVFLGRNLQPVLTTLRVGAHSQRLVRQNLWLALGYNIIAVPLAVLGYITPLWAAVAMSASSLVVILNALRLNSKRLGA